MSEPKKYRKKPVVIEAMQWDGTAEGATPIIDWILKTGTRSARFKDDEKHIPGPDRGITTIRERIDVDTLEGTMSALPGDWIIRGVSNEHYPCRADIFTATYKEASHE